MHKRTVETLVFVIGAGAVFTLLYIGVSMLAYGRVHWK